MGLGGSLSSVFQYRPFCLPSSLRTWRIMRWSCCHCAVRGILTLGVDQSVHDVDGIVLVGAYPSIENFLHAGFGIEVPGAAAVLHQGMRRRPVFRADIERDGRSGSSYHTMHLVVAANEIGQRVLVGNVVAGVKNLVRRSNQRSCPAPGCRSTSQRCREPTQPRREKRRSFHFPAGQTIPYSIEIEMAAERPPPAVPLGAGGRLSENAVPSGCAVSIA